MEQWFISAKKADFNQIGNELHISPVLARIMRNRELTGIEEMNKFLNGTLADLYEPSMLKDVEKGARIIREKIKDKKKIRIISDYDVDGVSSNYILYCGLKRCGAMVDYRIPNRIEDGYGINDHLISQAAEEGIDTIITCDNGIAALEQIKKGNEMGLTFVVTDHHEVVFTMEDNRKEEHLPEAAAVIDPKQSTCSYPFKSICGAVVAWKFIQVLYDLCSIESAECEQFLEIAALATVCDVMPLQDENRIIVKEGLERMNHTKIPGLKALIEESGLGEKRLRAYHMGFIIGPCINASGRLSTAKTALELLLCQDEKKCHELAKQLIEMNEERKEMTRQGEEAAKRYLESTGHIKDKVLVVFLPDCHESIAGIIAGRVREDTNKPVFVLTRTKDGVKGSGRSIEGYHMYNEMTAVRECFDKYGGHPMAAGLSMQEHRIEELRKKLNAHTTLTEKDFVKKVHIDVAVPVSYLTEHFIHELDRLEPFGNGNEKPLFAQKKMYINGVRELGNSGRCLKLQLKDENGYPAEAMLFGDISQFYKDAADSFGEEAVLRMKKGLPHPVNMALTYYPEINQWRGMKSIQIVIKNYRFPERKE